jgi:hypothetical protein
MTIFLLPNDIPMFWEAIKKCAIESGEIDAEHQASYLNELLNALLSSNAQCFARLSDERILEAIAISRVLYDKQRNQKYLYVQGLYSWQKKDAAAWQESIDFIKSFARSEGCSYIGCQSHNPAAWRIYEYIGMREVTRTFAMEVV